MCVHMRVCFGRVCAGEVERVSEMKKDEYNCVCARESLKQKGENEE